MKLEKCDVDNVDLGTVQLHLTVSDMQSGLKLGETLTKLVGSEVDIEAKKHREKRSLNANNYFYQLCGKIAETTDASKDEVHNRMLARYGQYQRDENNNIVFCLYPADIDYDSQPDVHLKPTGHIEKRKNVDYEWFVVMRGSHTYNTQEMAKLIDGVVSECHELKIDTMTPDEIKRMVGEYGNTQNVDN